MKTYFDLKKTSKKHTQPSHLYLTNSIVNFVFLQFLDDIRIVTLWESTSYKSTDNENHAVSRMKRFYIGNGGTSSWTAKAVKDPVKSCIDL